MFVPLVGKMSASKLIHYFSSHPVVFGFQASSPLDNITLLKRRLIDFLGFQTGIGESAFATLDTEQLISHTRTGLVDTIACLQGLD